MMDYALLFKKLNLQLFFYNLSIQLYWFIAKILSNFKPKAKLFVTGRKDIFEKIAADLQNHNFTIIWVHCASLGEFEQGRPVIEQLKAEHKNLKIVLTFFSPSGYEVRKNYAHADYIYYLPIDTAKNANKFIEIVQPKMAIFVKYEFWYHYLKALHQHKIPSIVISAIFQKRHIFFKWYGGLHKKMLGFIQEIFVQNQSSIDLLASIDIHQTTLAGDTRIDRAIAIANTQKYYENIEKFKGNNQVIIAGSTWLADEQLLEKTFQKLSNSNCKLIIAPHEIHQSHINAILNIFKNYNPILFSSTQNIEQSRVMIIDNIGHLAYIYRYASYVWIGGGFNKTGIHNSIEAAVYNKALFWGPRYNRYQEAIDLIAFGAAKSVQDATELSREIDILASNNTLKEKAELAAQQYISSNKGATSKIMNYIKLHNIF